MGPVAKAMIGVIAGGVLVGLGAVIFCGVRFMRKKRSGEIYNTVDTELPSLADTDLAHVPESLQQAPSVN